MENDHELIFYAGKGNNPQKLKIRIEESKFKINTKVNNSYLLLEAVKNGNNEIVDFLLTKGASKYTMDNKGNLPIHIAAMNNHLQVFKRLLDKKEDCLIKNNEELNVLELANLNNSNDIIKYLNSKNIRMNSFKSNEMKATYGVLKEKDLSLIEHLFILLYSMLTWKGLLGIFFFFAGINSWELTYGPLWFIVGIVVIFSAYRKKIRNATLGQ